MDNVHQDRIPTNVVIGLVSEAVYSGSTKKNPFNLVNCDVNYAAFLMFLVDGQSRPAQPLEPNFEAGLYASAFNSLPNKQDRTCIKHHVPDRTHRHQEGKFAYRTENVQSTPRICMCYRLW